MQTYDVIVIGAGLIGAAAGRHLGQAGLRAALIGPAEPAEPARHEGVFASHYDQGRVTRVLDRDLVWARLAQRSMRRYAALEADAGLAFHTPAGFLRIDHDPARHARAASVGQDLEVAFEALDAGALSAAFPLLAAPSGSVGLYEHGMAGFLNPRRLVEAQCRVAQRAGVALIRDTARSVEVTDGVAEVRTFSGARYRAGRVLVAAGAFANCFDLLPRKLALTIRPETVFLAPVSDDEAGAFRSMPSIWIELGDQPTLPHAYVVPPVRYPDGARYLKIGADHDRDVPFAGFDDYGRFFRGGGSRRTGAMLRDLTGILFPSLGGRSGRLKPCILAYASRGYPMVDRVADRVFVAVAGCGASAKSSDEIGRLAAELVRHDAWRDDLDERLFRAVFRD